MKRVGRGGFTLLELLTVVVIIMILAGMIVGVAGMARRRARIERCKAALDVVATACEAYWSQYRDYPYPEPTQVGDGRSNLDEDASFHQKYYSNDEWDNEARNVTLVWMLSMPRHPEPYLGTNQFCFEGVKLDDTILEGPDGRTLFRAIDGFRNAIRVKRPWQYYYSRTYLRLTSAGADEKFGDDEDPEARKDNLTKYLRR